MPRTYYTEFPSGKKRYTNGEFKGWLRGGPVGFIYAVFQRRSSVLYIPRQDIHDVDKLPALPENVPTALPRSEAS